MPVGIDLTEDQERQILALQAEGITFGEIAERLGLHRNTIGNFCKRHYRNVQSIQDAQAACFRVKPFELLANIASGKQKPVFDDNGKITHFEGPTERDRLTASEVLAKYAGASTNGHGEQSDENLQDIPDNQLLAALLRNNELLQTIVINKVGD